METAGAVSREGDLEPARRLVQKRKVGREMLEGDNGFDGDFGSVSEKKTYDLSVAVDAELDPKNEKKKKKKRKRDAVELEELGDGGSIMGDKNGGSVCESEDKTKLDKKKKKKAEKDTMELEEPDSVEMGKHDDSENGGPVCESEDKTKLDKKKRKKEKKKANKVTMELEEPENASMAEGVDRENGGSVCESEDKTKLDEKKRKKEKKKADKDVMELEDPDNAGMAKGDDRENGGSVCETEDKTKLDKKKRKKEKKKADKDTLELEESDNVHMDVGDDRENGGSVCESEDRIKLDKKKRKKEKKRADKDTLELEEQDNVDMGAGDGRVVYESAKCSVTLEESKQADKSKREDKKSKGKKNRKASGNTPQDVEQNTMAAGDVKSGNKEREKSKDKNDVGNVRKAKVLQRKDKGKRVSFTDSVEVFGDGVDDKESDKSGVGEKSDKGSEPKLVHGKRFTKEEDEQIMEAIRSYAEMKQLGEKGLEMIRPGLKNPEVRGCWHEISKALPHRPTESIYRRARVLLYRDNKRKWTEEEYEIIRQFVKKHGTNWKTLAHELGKSDIHVKDTWRRIKPINLRKGPWDQEEYQNLFDLVNMDLRIKANQKISQTHRHIRDNISWEAISDKLTTRSVKDCCLKWYKELASSLVKQGAWKDSDDYRLVEALQKVDAVCLEDVDWDNLLDNRSGEVCRKRWNQMVRWLGGHRERSFIEQVEVLSRRYSPEMIEYRK